jgi:ribose transport system substrate-binding protein
MLIGAVMTTQTESSPASVPVPAAKPRRTHFGFLLVLLLIALAALWYAGVFARKPHIALVAGEGPYFDMILAGAREAEKQYDVDLTIIRAKGDVQADAVRGLLDKKYDGIAVSPFDPAAEAALLSDVGATTTLVTYDSDTPLSNRLCFVGTDNYAAGRMCGQEVRQAIPAGEVIINVGALDKENVQHRRQGVIDELLDRPFEPTHAMDPVDEPQKTANSKYTVSMTQLDGPAPEAAAIDAMARALKAHPDVKCLVGLNAGSTPRLLKALESAGMSGRVQIVGFDADKGTLAGIEAGQVYASILQDQFGCGFHVVRILAENARGNRSGLPVFARRTLPVEIINKDNVASIRDVLNGERGLGQSAGTASAAPAPATSASAQ